MANPFIEIESIGEQHANTLIEIGIHSTEALIQACRSPRGRKSTSVKTGIGEALLLGWANRADLLRIRGVGKQYVGLLGAAGVESVKDLKGRKADAVCMAMRTVNDGGKFCKIPPSVAVVKKWIDHAKTLRSQIT